MLKTAKASEDVRTRPVGLPIPGLHDPLHITLADTDAIGDAIYDLDVLGLARRRPKGFFNLTAAGRHAA